MKKVLLVSIGCFALCIAATAFAADSKSGAIAGMYLGISGGIGGMDTPNETISASDYYDNSTALVYMYTAETKLRNGVTGRLFAGYLWGNEFKYGLELGGSLYPENKYKASDSESSASLKYNDYTLDLLGVARYNFVNFNIFGKAGAAYVWQNAELKGTNVFGSASETHTRSKILPEVAVGFGYDFTQNIGASVTYSHVFGQKFDHYYTGFDEKKVASINTFTLDLTYHFGNF